jgi:ATP-dependent Clp protease ATP-binding subunit ClpA
MFERLSGEARAVVVAAGAESVRAGQPQIVGEDFLIGLLTAPGPAADALAAAGVDVDGVRARRPEPAGTTPDPLDAEALASLGIDLDAVRRATDAAFGADALDRAGQPRGRRGLLGRQGASPEVKRILERSLHAAVSRGDHSLSSGHLLLGVLEVPDGSAATALRAAGADLAALRADLLRRLAVAA